MGGNLLMWVSGSSLKVILFLKLDKIFFGHFNPKNSVFLIIQIINSWADVTDTSARTAAVINKPDNDNCTVLPF